MTKAKAKKTKKKDPVAEDSGGIPTGSTGENDSADSPDESESGAKRPAKPVVELCQELVRYEFTESELAKLGSSVAELTDSVERKSEQKKSAVADFDSEIKKIGLTISDLLRNLRDKWEMRTMDVYCVRDYKSKKAYYFRSDKYTVALLSSLSAEEIRDCVDSGGLEPAKERDLKPWELQRELDFKDKEERDEIAADFDASKEEGEKNAADMVDEETGGGADPAGGAGKEVVSTE